MNHGWWWPDYVDVIWEPRDMWIGVYRTGMEQPTVRDGRTLKRWRWFLILIPCIALRLTWVMDSADYPNVATIGGQRGPA